MAQDSVPEMQPDKSFANQPFNPEQYQATASSISHILGTNQGDSKYLLPNMTSSEELLHQLGYSSAPDGSARENIQLYFSAECEANKLYPGSSPAQKELKEAAFDYILNGEGALSSSSAITADVKLLDQDSPDKLGELNNYLREQLNDGHRFGRVGHPMMD